MPQYKPYDINSIEHEIYLKKNEKKNNLFIIILYANLSHYFAQIILFKQFKFSQILIIHSKRRFQKPLNC